MRKETALCAIVLLVGCMPEFDEEWLVKDLRILGIRAEPPEVLLPAESIPLPPITVDALVGNPAAPSSQLFTWELWVCTPESRLCDGATMQTLLRRDSTTLGDITHHFVLSDSFRRTALELFAKWRAEAGWVPLTLELRIFQFQHGGPVIRGVKQTRLADANIPGREPNNNPKLQRVEVDGQPLTNPIRIDRCRTVELSVWVDDPDAKGSVGLDVYTSQGRFTSRSSGESSFAVHWNPCSRDDNAPVNDEAYLWLVVRDGRGGIDWLELELSIADAA